MDNEWHQSKANAEIICFHRDIKEPDHWRQCELREVIGYGLGYEYTLNQVEL